jgi:CheY-like chemotaxis protein
MSFCRSFSGSALNFRPTVLLVEDDNYVRAAVWTLLKYSDFDVTVAGSGAEGFKLAGSLSPDIVVLDADLPEMTGLEICSRLKADRGTSNLPVVFLSAHNELAQQAFELGAEAFLVKRNDFGRLADCLVHILATRAINQPPQSRPRQ